MKTIKIIDLLNKIANGEEVPIKFTYQGYLWEYDLKNKMWFYYFGESKCHRFDRLFYLNVILNDEVKIIEEKKIPEKIGLINYIEDPATLLIHHKVDEIIDYLDYLESKEKGE